MTSIEQLRTTLERRKGKKEQVSQMLEETQAKLVDLRKQAIRHENAREIIREVGIQTQQQLSFHISDITSLALDAVFDNAYELKVDFVQRRNKTECDLLFVRDGQELDPLSASGGGAVDVAAFALRIASWSMQNPKSRPVIILDEPLRFLSEGHQEKASQMIKEISQKLGIQFIVITHNKTLTTYADKVFEVTNRKGKSKVESYEPSLA